LVFSTAARSFFIDSSLPESWDLLAECDRVLLLPLFFELAAGFYKLSDATGSMLKLGFPQNMNFEAIAKMH
jgi:hypothetical protein